jgi:excisionase family DNA binding protein
MAVATEAEPLYISVTEAAHLLGISRTLAYEQAHLGIDTEGAEGLPAIRLGRRVLVNRTRMFALGGADAR